MKRETAAVNVPSQRLDASILSLLLARITNDSMLLFLLFSGHPAPAFVAPSWQLPLTQPSQVLANFEPKAAVLIPKLRFVFHHAPPAA
jgi:hypothetical protein